MASQPTQERLQSLLTHRLQCAEDVCKSAKDVLRSAEHDLRLEILRTAYRDCRDFAAAFRATLPRKIRDMVYKHVWREINEYAQLYEARYSVIRASRRFNNDPHPIWKPWLWTCNQDPRACFHWKHVPLWVLPLFVGYAVAREAAIVHYQTIPGSLIGWNIHQLKALLTVDHLHLGLVPAEHIYAWLTVRISVNHCKQLKVGPKDRRISSRGYMIIKENLEALSKVKPRDGWRVEFKLWQKGRQAYNVLQVLRPIYYELKDADVEVEVSSFVNSRFKNGIKDPYESYGWWAYDESKGLVPGDVDFRENESEDEDALDSASESEHLSSEEDDDYEDVLDSGSESEDYSSEEDGNNN